MAKDPYRYFRIEAAELIDSLAQGVLAFEKVGGAESVSRLLRAAHTLKGAARVVRVGTIADLAHDFEEQMVPLRAESRTALPAEIDRCLALVDRMRFELCALDGGTAQGGDPAPGPASAQAARAVRTDSIETDALVESLAGANRSLAELGIELDGLEQARVAVLSASAALGRHGGRAPDGHQAKELLDGLGERLVHSQRAMAVMHEQLQRELSEMRTRIERMRLQPLSMLFAPLERVLRDAARELVREVRWEALGGELGVDTAVLTVLSEALPHMVRNAVAHGIESPAGRGSAGKPAQGVVRMVCSRQGSRISIALSDDGRGLDFAAIEAAAQARGLLKSGQRCDQAMLTELLLRGGLSTSAQVTGVSGRGVGLDAARAAVAGLRGTLALGSRPGGGTTVEIQVPASLSSVPALLVHAGGSVVAIPLDAVLSAMRLEPRAVIRSGSGEAVAFAERTVPLAPLASLIGGATGAQQSQQRTVVVLHAGGAEAALEIDQLVGTAEATVRQFPPGVRPVAVLTGTAIDNAGAPWLVLDAAAAVGEVRAWKGGPTATVAAGAKRRLPILVIDDSLTTRTLEQSILESAGYQVDIAISAEQGLGMAASRRYGLFVVDVEMPGMSGFEFVERTRADPGLRQVPAILVTSRSTPEDRQRGRDAGASAYMVKAEFDQRRLLEIISGLMG